MSVTQKEIVEALLLAEDGCFNQNIDNVGIFRDLANRIEREGIATPSVAVGEPVAWVTEPDLLGKRKWVTVTPPSVDALIAEIESVGVNNHMAIQAILDKYRSAK